MASYEQTDTPIAGVKILLNKVVSDERGHFIGLAESDNPALGDLKNLHASVATTKHVARGTHYHHRLTENFYTLAGTALWILHDFDKDSATHGVTHALVLGDGKKNIKTTLPTFYIDGGHMAQLTIGPGVYHAFWPLTDAGAVVFVTGNTDYDPKDFVRPTLEEIPGAQKILKEHGIKT